MVTRPRPGRAADRRSGDERLDRAVHGLADWRADLSAAEPLWPVQALVLAAGTVILALMAVSAGPSAAAILSWVFAAPFLVAAVVRLGALRLMTAGAGNGGRRGPDAALSVPDADLPAYTVLVPLYREEGVAPQIVDALLALDYPAQRLQILIIVEATDPGTRATIEAARALPAHMRFVVVPDGVPRTKPRALNYALVEATGEFVVVYDAEDIPEPDQLRLAAAAFARDPDVGCLQARLNIYNADDSWLSRQFTMEYTALFDALLPMIARLGWPVPLGGTSNHFRRRVLESCGGWDAFNVTEDADLGVRLARFGWRVGVLDSTTWEEAPVTWRVWRGQRTRWIKGWLQTWLVHSRRPIRLVRDLGGWGSAGFHLWSAAVLVSALVHPWLYIGMLWRLMAAPESPPAASDAMSTMQWLTLANLGAGYVSAMALGHAAAARRNLRLRGAALALPLYWLAISVAAHRAIIELIRAPFHWEKTEHRGSGPSA